MSPIEMNCFTFIQLAVLLIVTREISCVPPAFIKEPFDKERFTVGHTWWVHSYTAALYGDTDKCAHFKIKQTDENLLLFVQFTSSQNRVENGELVITQDTSHPAKFFVDAGDTRVFEMRVVEADYDNWALCWAKGGDQEAYNIVATTQDISPYESAIKDVVAKLKLNMGDFKLVKNENCKDSLPV